MGATTKMGPPGGFSRKNQGLSWRLAAHERHLGVGPNVPHPAALETAVELDIASFDRAGHAPSVDAALFERVDEEEHARSLR